MVPGTSGAVAAGGEVDTAVVLANDPIPFSAPDRAPLTAPRFFLTHQIEFYAESFLSFAIGYHKTDRKAQLFHEMLDRDLSLSSQQTDKEFR